MRDLLLLISIVALLLLGYWGIDMTMRAGVFGEVPGCPDYG